MAGTKRTRSKVPDAPKPDPPKADKKTKAAKASQKADQKAAQKNDKTKKRDAKDQAKKKADAAVVQAPASSDSEEEKEEIVQRDSKVSNGVLVDHKVPNLSTYEVVKYNGTILN